MGGASSISPDLADLKSKRKVSGVAFVKNVLLSVILLAIPQFCTLLAPPLLGRLLHLALPLLRGLEHAIP